MNKDKENNEEDNLDTTELGNSVVIVDTEELSEIIHGGDAGSKRKRVDEANFSDESGSSFADSSLEPDPSVSDPEELVEKKKYGSYASAVTNQPIDTSIEDFDKNLPETVTLLKTEFGSKVYVIGTAHFSEESQQDVSQVIQRVQPDYVVVELCSSRGHVLTWDEETLLAEAQSINFQKANEIIRSNGVVQGGMYLMLLSMSAHITRQLGMAPGGEFRRAFREAQNIKNCIIQLGDRPIQITLKRALASLSWWQSAKLAFHLLFQKDPISKEDVEKCKKRDFLETMIAEMAGDYPELKKVFVNERDTYLTYSLQNAALPELGHNGIKPSKVVGVVGMGHLPGIQERWGKVKDSDILPIISIPPKPISSTILKYTVRLTLVACVVYGINKVVPLPLPDLSSVKSYFK